MYKAADSIINLSFDSLYMYEKIQKFKLKTARCLLKMFIIKNKKKHLSKANFEIVFFLSFSNEIYKEIKRQYPVKLDS